MTTWLLHQIGDRKHGTNFNTLEEILATDPKDVLTFDGVYESVYEQFKLGNLNGLKGRKIIFFVTGDYMGKTNAFDIGQPLSKFCALRYVEDMAEGLGAKIGWHGKRHRNVRGMHNTIDVQQEIERPYWWATTRDAIDVLAWPYGEFLITGKPVEAPIIVAKRLGFKEAYSVTQALPEDHHDYKWAQKRQPLNW